MLFSSVNSEVTEVCVNVTECFDIAIDKMLAGYSISECMCNVCT